MTIYCDESGGIGRGVMTVAGISIEADVAEKILTRFREVTGYLGEVKGSRIDLSERALLFELIKDSPARMAVNVAISALQPEPGDDRGAHDAAIYEQLLETTIRTMHGAGIDCENVIIDDGRYDPKILAEIRSDIALMIGPCSKTSLELSHHSAGLQLADVIANSFFNRALVNDRQARMAAIVAPLLESGQISLKVLPDERA